MQYFPLEGLNSPGGDGDGGGGGDGNGGGGDFFTFNYCILDIFYACLMTFLHLQKETVHNFCLSDGEERSKEAFFFYKCNSIRCHFSQFIGLTVGQRSLSKNTWSGSNI